MATEDNKTTSQEGRDESTNSLYTVDFRALLKSPKMDYLEIRKNESYKEILNKAEELAHIYITALKNVDPKAIQNPDALSKTIQDFQQELIWHKDNHGFSSKVAKNVQETYNRQSKTYRQNFSSKSILATRTKAFSESHAK